MQKELIFKSKITEKKLQLGKRLANRKGISLFNRVCLFLKSGNLIKITRKAIIFL